MNRVAKFARYMLRHQPDVIATNVDEKLESLGREGVPGLMNRRTNWLGQFGLSGRLWINRPIVKAVSDQAQIDLIEKLDQRFGRPACRSMVSIWRNARAAAAGSFLNAVFELALRASSSGRSGPDWLATWSPQAESSGRSSASLASSAVALSFWRDGRVVVGQSLMDLQRNWVVFLSSLSARLISSVRRPEAARTPIAAVAGGVELGGGSRDGRLAPRELERKICMAT